MLPENPKHIAVLRTAALGDICMTTPLMIRLREHFPDAKIHWIIREDMSSLVDDLPGIHFIKIKKPNSWARWKQAIKQLKPYRFDALLMPQSSLRSNVLSLFIHAKVKYGYDSLHSKDGQRFFVNKRVTAVREHAVDAFLRFAEALGTQQGKPSWEIPLSDKDREFASTALAKENQRVIAICPTSSKRERNWNPNRYIQLIDQLKRKLEASIVLIGGADKLSQSACETIMAGSSHELLRPKTQNLKQLTALLEQCDLLIAPDTGPVHIANAVGTPVVGLYAVMSSTKTGPYDSQALCVDKYADAVQKFSNKNPNYVSWNHRVHHPEAMDLIEVSDVMHRINAWYKSA
jgi:heptosyltransferase I